MAWNRIRIERSVKQMKTNETAAKRLLFAGALLLFLGALILVYYYLRNTANRFITSDSVDSLLWAQASLEDARLVSRSFDYATLLPLGGHLLMMPFVALYGLSPLSQSYGMMAFFLLFTASVVFCLRSFGWRYTAVLTATAFVLLMTLIAPITRMLLYHHILYYSQGLAYLMVGLGLLTRMTRRYERGQPAKAALCLALLAPWMLLTAVNGEMTLAIFSIPLMGAYLLERMLSRPEGRPNVRQTEKPLTVFLTLGAGVAAGFAVRLWLIRGIDTEYADGITSLAAFSDWQEHLANLPQFWMSLVTGQSEQVKILSATGIITVLQLMAGLVLAAVPVIALVRYRTLTERWERLLVLAHWVTAGVILFLYVFARYGEAPWRLLPVFLTSLLVTFAWLKRWLTGARLPQKRIAALLALLLATNAAWSGLFIIKLPSSIFLANAYGLVEFLESNGLTDGYATYWNASGPTVYACERVRIRPILFEKGGVVPQRYQSNRNWYTLSLDTCFLLVTAQEGEAYADCIPQDYDQLLAYGDDCVYVYHRNIIEP